MKKIFIYISEIIAVVLVSTVSFGLDSGTSLLLSENKSDVEARVKFLQRADGFISIEGEATGLVPNRTYFQFLW